MTNAADLPVRIPSPLRRAVAASIEPAILGCLGLVALIAVSLAWGLDSPGSQARAPAPGSSHDAVTGD